MPGAASSRAPRPPSLPRPKTVRGVVFDGDDTLWLTEALYDDARAAARLVVEEAGLDGDAWEAAQRARDLANVATLGHSTDRFPTSAVEAFEAVAGKGHDRHETAACVRVAASSVFFAPAPLRADATEVLLALVQRRKRLALVTKGDETVQRRRIEQSGLGSLFEVITIVDHKAASTFAAVASQLGIDVGNVVSVGNSVESDIRPSIEAGIYALWLPAYVWEYERHDPAVEDDLHRIDCLRELLDIVPG